MKKQYKIRGISKILEQVDKKDLAASFQVETDADFEAIITESLRKHGVPSGIEIAGYEAIDRQDMKGGMDGYLHSMCEKYIKDGKAAIGMHYPITNKNLTELYFYVDEPIRDEALYGIFGAKTHLGGVSTLGHTMGKGFYEAHKDEIAKFQEEFGRTMEQKSQFNEYVRDYFDRLSGQKDREDDENDYYFEWERERARAQKERMQSAEQLISQLTGGKSIEEVTLQDLEQIKQGLIDRQRKVQEAFAERFGTKESEQAEE